MWPGGTIDVVVGNLKINLDQLFLNFILRLSTPQVERKGAGGQPNLFCPQTNHIHMVEARAEGNCS